MSCLCPLFILQIALRFVFYSFDIFARRICRYFRFEFSLACLVCFRRPAGGQGEEQEDGGGDGGGLPGYPEHVIPRTTCIQNKQKPPNPNHLPQEHTLKLFK